jgi:hydrogenase maturation protease
LTPLVLGIGNPWRGDDGAGAEVARELRRRAATGARIVEYGGEPAGLIDAWQDAGDVVLIDSVISGAPPGTVHRLDLHAGPLPPELSSASTHHLGVAEAVELARVLKRLPARLELYGIEGGAFGVGEPLGPEVRNAVHWVAAELAERLRG